MQEEPTLESKRIYDGKVLSLRVDSIRLPDGGTASREVVEHGASVVMVPIDDRGQALLVRQYRKAPEQSLLEAPAGGLEDGESPEDGVLRELQEEIGHPAGKLVRMTGFWIAPGFCTEYMHTYIATDLSPSALAPDEDENIEVVPVPLDRIPELIRSGEIQDGKSIAALLMALHLHADEL